MLTFAKMYYGEEFAIRMLEQEILYEVSKKQLDDYYDLFLLDLS